MLQYYSSGCLGWDRFTNRIFWIQPQRLLQRGGQWIRGRSCLPPSGLVRCRICRCIWEKYDPIGLSRKRDQVHELSTVQRSSLLRECLRIRWQAVPHKVVLWVAGSRAITDHVVQQSTAVIRLWDGTWGKHIYIYIRPYISPVVPRTRRVLLGFPVCKLFAIVPTFETWGLKDYTVDDLYSTLIR